ncbi:MAG: hypothetical protein ACP5NX_03605 [Candidatus Bilamarchaeaceae archaeon]
MAAEANVVVSRELHQLHTELHEIKKLLKSLDSKIENFEGHFEMDKPAFEDLKKRMKEKGAPLD